MNDRECKILSKGQNTLQCVIMHITGLLRYELWKNARNHYNNVPEDRALILVMGECAVEIN